jgi:phosphatidylserine synthase 2
MIVIITANFLTGFFMINGLWIPPVNWINIYRLLVWFLLAAITFAEMWDDIKTWGKETRKKLKITSEFR